MRTLTVPGTALGLILCVPLHGVPQAEDVDYATRIKPLLAARCHKCHGPEKQKSKLRLDYRAGAFQGGDSTPNVIVPGKSARSDMVRRIRSADPDVRMPPKGDRLSPKEIELIRRWIDEGAKWPAAADPSVPERTITA